MPAKVFNYIIIGAGVMGLSIARALRQSQPGASILILDKEEDVGAHSSGRNSGVLHAGFYYTADSLKARFTVQGARAIKDYCQAKKIPVNVCGKLVVAMDAAELALLQELERRGQRNGSNVSLIDAAEARVHEPGIFTHKKALYSPDTASVDPLDILVALKDDLMNAGVEFVFEARFLRHSGMTVMTNQGEYAGKKIINCAGLYADRVAHDYGLGQAYTMIPFKGLYLKYARNKTDVHMNVYPVPNLKNPFLGVHFTKTVDGTIKIGPTAIPAFWRENYALTHRFHPGEMAEILCEEARLFMGNNFGFRDLAIEEMRKYERKYFISLAQKLIPAIDPNGFGEFTRPGIRAQLLDRHRRALVQDFVVEADKISVHILNAVSPAFTCAFPFAAYVCREFVV